MTRKLLLINPTQLLDDGQLHRSSRRWLIGITLPYLAALTPPEWDVRIVDECFDAVDFDEPCDLVGITFMSHHTPRAFQISDEFRARGVPVVMGGFHASAEPQEALAHCDAVVVGEAENVWAGLLDDAKAGRLGQIYQAPDLHDMKGLPTPRYDLLDMRRYKMPAVENFIPVQTSRGCPFDCRFCEVTRLYGNTYRFRPVDEVVGEIESLEARSVYFVDDNIAANRKRARELFRALKPLQINWTGLINMFTGKDVELLDLMIESGCKHVNLGLESINSASLAEMNKPQNQVEDYRLILRNLRERGLFFSANLVLGLDSDTVESFEETVAFLRHEKVPMAFMFIVTPRVGTALREDMEKEGRLLHNDWHKYAGWNCVYQPAGFSPEELEQAFWHTYQKFYSPASIIQRIVPTFMDRKSWLITLASNLFFAWGVRRSKAPTSYY
jgi:radical SAM superfamily enzyme YgiQ (UPF0313 family)